MLVCKEICFVKGLYINMFAIHTSTVVNKPFQHIDNRNYLTSYEKGISAELCAKNYLVSKGYKIIGKRIRNIYGEIDILATKDRDIVAVEVKQRKSLDSSKDSITYKQKCRISNAFNLIVSQMKEMFENYRIDVVCFDRLGRFEHIENAFYIEDNEIA